MIFNSFCNVSSQISISTGSGNCLWSITVIHTKPLPQQCWLVNWSPTNTLKSNFINNSNIFISRKCIWNFHLQNVSHSVQLSLSHKILKCFDKYSQPSHNFMRPLSTMSWLKSYGQIYIWINVNVNTFITYHVYNSITADNTFDFAKEASYYSNIANLTHWGLVKPYGIMKLWVGYVADKETWHKHVNKINAHTLA